VLARAIARDLFEGEALSRVLAMIIVAMAAAPGFSPLLGSVAETFFGWRVTFMLVSAMGLLLAAWYATQLGETLSPQSQAPLAIGPVFATYGKLLMDRRFVSPALVVGCVIGGLYGFFAAAPAILMGALGLSSHELGLLFAGTVFVVFAAGLIGPRLSRRWGTQRTIRLGLGLAFVGGVLVWLASARESLDLLSFTAAICVFLFGMGMVNPLSTALSLAPFGAQAGSASAMLGFVQMMGAALGATLVTKLSYFPPMATLGLLIAASQILAIAAFGLLPVPRPDSQG
jgi:DHA1 family bicyclomycin/chloramphenicol resistance-like MFS transporter